MGYQRLYQSKRDRRKTRERRAAAREKKKAEDAEAAAAAKVAPMDMSSSSSSSALGEGGSPSKRKAHAPPVQEVETISPAKKAKQEAGSKANMERAANSLSMKDNELLWFQHLIHNTALTKREIRLVLTMVQDKYMRKLKRQKQCVTPQMKERLWEECSRKYIKSTQWGYEQQSRMRKLFKEYYEKRPYTRDACDTRTTERK